MIEFRTILGGNEGAQAFCLSKQEGFLYFSVILHFRCTRIKHPKLIFKTILSFQETLGPGPFEQTRIEP